MKRAILILMLLFLVVFSFGDAMEVMDYIIENVAVDYLFGVNYFANGYIHLYSAGVSNYMEGDFSVLTEVTFTFWNIFFIGGSIEVYEAFMPSAGAFYNDRIDSLFNVGLTYGMFTIGYKHMCIHPIMPFAGKRLAVNYNLEGGYDVIYFRVEGRL